MTDQPSEPHGTGTPAGSPYATPPGTPYSSAPPPPRTAAAPEAAPGGSPFGAAPSPTPEAGPPAQQSPHGGTPVPPNPYGGPPADQNPSGAPPPQQNPYAPAPAVGPGMPASPESLAVVEARFGHVATFGERVPAYLIDLGITLSGLVIVILGFIVLWFGSSGSVTLDNGAVAETPGDPALTAFGVILVVLGYVAMFGLWLWNRVFTMGRTGQSVGKRSQGLKLIDARTGEPIGAGSSFLREVVAGLANQIFYLSFLWMLWDPERQTLGDKAVHSTVVHVPRGDAAATF